MFKLFFEGGALGMSLLTLELVALLLAAWKAPGWVKEIGLIALVTGVLWTLAGVCEMAAGINRAGDVSQGLLWGGLRVAIIPLIYCEFIYLASLVIRIIQKPRLL
jgi:hypothetical protein